LKFVIGRALTILSWDNPVTAFFRKSRKLRHSLGRPSRSDFVQWVFCKHKERDTFEVPGGHREAGENTLETAKRELQEETGAIKFDIKPVCVYSVTGKTRVNDTGEESFGGLYFAEISEFAKELHSEMEKVVLMDELPDNWTYPLIQPKLIEKYLQIERQTYSKIQLAQSKL